MTADVRRMIGLVRPEGWQYALGLAALLVVNLADVAGPLLIGAAVDLVAQGLAGTPGSSSPAGPLARLGISSAALTVTGAVGGYLALQVIANLLRYPMVMRVSVPSHRVGQVIRNRITGHLLRLSRPFYDRARTGDLMSLATADVNAVRMFFGPGILLLVDTVLLIVFVLAVMFSLSWSLTLAALCPAPFIALFTQRFSLAEFSRFGKVQEDIARLTERARETYAGIRVLQGYVREDEHRRRFADHSHRHLLLNLRLARIRALFEPSLDLLLGLSTVLVVVVGGAQLARGTLSVGSFTAFLYLVANLSGPMIGFGWAVSLFQRGRASLQRIEALLAEPVEIADRPGAAALAPDGATRLTVRDLTYGYAAASRPALDGVSFELGAGRTLGVIGPVGSGKSTLAALLVRLYDPPPGTVLLDGKDIRDLTIDALRAAVALAPQDAFLFGDTVAGNILLAPAAAGKDPAALARLAQIDEEVAALPDGYQTLLGERGVNLSGGQRQRLALARAIAADPRVLVLDDCLSAVDAKTEAAILDSLGLAFAGRAGLVISHRVRAVARCDEIIVLEGGRVTARGTHEQLLAASAFYAAIAREQAAGEAE